MNKTELKEAFAQIEDLINRAEALADTPGTEARIYALLKEGADLTRQLVAQKLSEKLPPWVANKLANAMAQLQEQNL
jgi:hypothetical protein